MNTNSLNATRTPADQQVAQTKYCQVSLKPAGTGAAGVGVERSQPWASRPLPAKQISEEIIHKWAAEVNQATPSPYRPANRLKPLNETGTWD